MSIRITKKINTDRFEDIIRVKLSEMVIKCDEFAQQLYASLCNTVWYNKSTNDIYSCSWRYAGGLVAAIRNKQEDYLNFYCTGKEGCYHLDVYKELNKLGYKSIQYKTIEHLQEFNFK